MLHSKKIPITTLADYVAKMSMENLAIEFQTIPNKFDLPHEESEKEENINRNRYNDLYPYDFNRVQLKSGPTDYINASYIDGFRKEKQFIAATGPTRETTNDFSTFWIMVWQEKVETIAILTVLYEGEKMKCEQYWPDTGQTGVYGNVKVSGVDEEKHEDYTVRTFSVAKDREKRNVVHYHYTAWPDLNVPDDVIGLLNFRNRVMTADTNLNGPVLVHCSAGVGRSGTFIALDILTKEGAATGHVDVYSTVLRLRQQRVCMVETEEQYWFLHNALLRSLSMERI